MYCLELDKNLTLHFSFKVIFSNLSHLYQTLYLTLQTSLKTESDIITIMSSQSLDAPKIQEIQLNFKARTLRDRFACQNLH